VNEPYWYGETIQRFGDSTTLANTVVWMRGYLLERDPGPPQEPEPRPGIWERLFERPL